MGREVALRMGDLGWRLALVDINPDTGAEVLNEVHRQGETAQFMAVDLGSGEGPGAMVRWTSECFGRLDVLINCAAYAAVEPFGAMTATAWERSLLVNVRGIALAIDAAAAVMRSQGGGHIINITSPASRMALPLYSHYAASKAAVDSLTRSAAVALAPDNIRVNSVAPGMMDTPLQKLTEEKMAALEGREDLEVYLAERTARIPLKRRAEIGEIAQAVVWLATEAPPYLTAERLNISGGLDRD